MIINIEDSYLRVRIVYSIQITRDLKKKVVKPWAWYLPWKPEEYEEEEIFQLTIKYLSEDEMTYNTSWTCPTKQPLIELKDKIYAQLKAQDHEIMDRAFEDAVNNLGKNK